MGSGIFISRSEWSGFDEGRMAEYRESVFRHYRDRGFPYYPTDAAWRTAELERFLSFDDSGVIRDGEILQTMHGLGFCWSFMPHSFGVRCGAFRSPLEAFGDDAVFRSVIRKRTLLGDNMSDAGIRKMLRMHTGVQGVSNFRPTAASAIYSRFAKGGVVWDMSAGYGGRLLGACKAGVKRYIGTDPCGKTCDGLNAMIRFLEEYDAGNLIGRFSTECEIVRRGSEETELEPGSVDFCFTSPPYFDTEKYSEEDTQSWKRYGSRESWRDGFLRKTFLNCRNCLRPGGVMAINIANVKSYPDLEKDTVRTAEDCGFRPYNTLRYSLSHMSGGCKHEPLFVFSV